ncbi:MAG TPA: GPW/gp25 family protein [Myxococcales bacterium]|jgi:type VI secretion system protein
MRTPFLDKFRTDRSARPGEDELDHVLRNLESVLNTKEGYGSFLRGFGLGEYTEKAGTRDLVAALLAEMKGEIRKHEPRLDAAELRPLGRDAGLAMHFELTGTVAGNPVRLRLRFDTTTGRVQVHKERR